MSWIELDGLYVNLSQVRTFWWEQADTYHAYLYLGYGSGDVMTIVDPYQVKYNKVRGLLGLPF